MNHRPTVAVFGASGFVGRSAVQALEARGAEVIPIPAPRMMPILTRDVADFVRDSNELRYHLGASIGDARAVVNAAGISQGP